MISYLKCLWVAAFLTEDDEIIYSTEPAYLVIDESPYDYETFTHV